MTSNVSSGTGSCGRCVFSVLIPLAIATATILVSTVMMGLSAEEADESHRLERDAVWDIPVMDTLRLWKRSMGTVGSGKVRFEFAYENEEIQVGRASAPPPKLKAYFISTK